jgi:hypothetical protein
MDMLRACIQPRGLWSRAACRPHGSGGGRVACRSRTREPPRFFLSVHDQASPRDSNKRRYPVPVASVNSWSIVVSS